MVDWKALIAIAVYTVVGFVALSLKTYFKGRGPMTQGLDEVLALLLWPFVILAACLDEWHQWLYRHGPS